MAKSISETDSNFINGIFDYQNLVKDTKFISLSEIVSEILHILADGGHLGCHIGFMWP